MYSLEAPRSVASSELLKVMFYGELEKITSYYHQVLLLNNKSSADDKIQDTVNHLSVIYNNKSNSNLIFFIILLLEVISQLRIEVIAETKHVTIFKPHHGMSASACYTCNPWSGCLMCV